MPFCPKPLVLRPQLFAIKKPNKSLEMCTLSIYPKPKNEGFIITFNRDETPSRSSINIKQEGESGLIYPQDALHGGTWFAFSPQKNRFTCLLNGAFELHKRTLPYRKSRGLVVLESFDFDSIHLFCTHFDFEGIEPCTMLLMDKNTWIELRWDGEQRHIKILEGTTPHIWSSCTLYNAEVRQLREHWFADFFKKMNGETPTPQHLWQFHKTPNDVMPENGILMQRASGPCTVSISQLNFDFFTQIINFNYHELESERKHEYTYATHEGNFITA